MRLITLCRRLETLEQSMSVTDNAAEAKIQKALRQISQQEKGLLIHAAPATLQDRELMVAERGATQAYAAALESDCRPFGLTVRRRLDVSESITLAHFRERLPEIRRTPRWD